MCRARVRVRLSLCCCGIYHGDGAMGDVMNDCVFFEACPEDCKCAGCKDYISMNCELGEEIMRTYVLKIEEACKPVVEWLRGVRDGNN